MVQKRKNEDVPRTSANLSGRGLRKGEKKPRFNVYPKPKEKMRQKKSNEDLTTWLKRGPERKKSGKTSAEKKKKNQRSRGKKRDSKKGGERDEVG